MRTAILVVSLLLAFHSVAIAAARPIGFYETNGAVVMHYDGRTLLVYASATNQFKPYVRELYTLRGENVLLDAPKDHIHHHGLMYAVAVNGINFWEEQTDPGVQKPLSGFSGKSGVNTSGLPYVWFTQSIHWVARTNRFLIDTEPAALLVEKRTLCMTVNEAQQEVAVEWISEFTVGPKMRDAILSGSSYFGLGMRFPRSFDHICAFQNGANKPYLGEKPGDVIKAPWTSAQARIDGKEVTVAVFGSSANHGGPPWFYSMVDNFAYLTATQNLHKQPITYGAGQKFKLRYLVTVYPGAKTAQFLNQRIQQWDR